MANEWDDVVGMTEYDENLKRIEGIANSKGYRLNQNNERVKKVVGLMTMNYQEHGKYFCPCKQSDPLDEVNDVLCPCPALDEEVKKDGHCYCKLFFRVKKH
ncbi:MAG TPA: ferredoxin-thioredoxin reductase catalytic domain-containing protein [bacterium]